MVFNEAAHQLTGGLPGHFASHHIMVLRGLLILTLGFTESNTYFLNVAERRRPPADFPFFAAHLQLVLVKCPFRTQRAPFICSALGPCVWTHEFV